MTIRYVVAGAAVCAMAAYAVATHQREPPPDPVPTLQLPSAPQVMAYPRAEVVVVEDRPIARAPAVEDPRDAQYRQAVAAANKRNDVRWQSEWDTALDGVLAQHPELRR